jgi:hypothetical protein
MSSYQGEGAGAAAYRWERGRTGCHPGCHTTTLGRVGVPDDIGPLIASLLSEKHLALDLRIAQNPKIVSSRTK